MDCIRICRYMCIAPLMKNQGDKKTENNMKTRLV